jgi:hypothetical protein
MYCENNGNYTLYKKTWTKLLETEICRLSRDRIPVMQATVSWGTCLHDIACFRDVEEAHVFQVEQLSRYVSCSFRPTTCLHYPKSLCWKRYKVPRQRVCYRSSASIFGVKFEFCFEVIITRVTAPIQSQKRPHSSSYSYYFLWRSLTIPCKQSSGYVQPAVKYKLLRFTHLEYL